MHIALELMFDIVKLESANMFIALEMISTRISLLQSININILNRNSIMFHQQYILKSAMFEDIF